MQTHEWDSVDVDVIFLNLSENRLNSHFVTRERTTSHSRTCRHHRRRCCRSRRNARLSQQIIRPRSQQHTEESTPLVPQERPRETKLVREGRGGKKGHRREERRPHWGWKDARGGVRRPPTPARCFFTKTNAVIRDASRVTRMREHERKERSPRNTGGRERGREREREREKEREGEKEEKRDQTRRERTYPARTYERIVSYVHTCVRARVRRGRNEGGYFCGAYRGPPV